MHLAKEELPVVLLFISSVKFLVMFRWLWSVLQQTASCEGLGKLKRQGKTVREACHSLR